MERKVKLEAILNEIGYVGRTQIFYFALICFISFLAGAFLFVYVFTAGDLNYRCYIDECDKNAQKSVEYNPVWLKYAVPFDGDTELPEKCFVYQRNNSREQCGESDFNDKVTLKCDKFVFETVEETILTDFNLTCNGNKWKLTLPGTLNSAGKFFNMVMIGYFSDRFGRKIVFIGSALLASTMALTQTVALNYWWFLVFTFLETFLGGSTYTIAIVLSLELVSPEYRTAVGSVIFATGASGSIFLGLVAMWVLNWKMLIWIVYIPNFIIISYIWMLPESITWLQMKGRYQDIADILLKIDHWNKTEVSTEVLDILINKPEMIFENADDPTKEVEKSETFPIRDVLRSWPMMLRTMSLAFCWLAIIFIFYGLSIISVAVGANKFIDFIIASGLEIPACAMVTVVSGRVGRKTVLCSTIFISGSVLLIYTFVSDMYWPKMILFMTGKFTISMTACTMYIYTSELVPTNLRQTLLGICSAFGGIGALIAVQAPLLEAVMKHLSVYVFATLALIGGLVALQFPETLKCKLPDTIEEALALGKIKQKKSELPNVYSRPGL